MSGKPSSSVAESQVAGFWTDRSCPSFMVVSHHGPRCSRGTGGPPDGSVYARWSPVASREYPPSATPVYVKRYWPRSRGSVQPTVNSPCLRSSYVNVDWVSWLVDIVMSVKTSSAVDD